MIACRNGHYDIAYYLLHNIGVDCEQTGSGNNIAAFIEGPVEKFLTGNLCSFTVTFDGETIESAPPLW